MGEEEPLEVNDERWRRARAAAQRRNPSMSAPLMSEAALDAVVPWLARNLESELAMLLGGGGAA